MEEVRRALEEAGFDEGAVRATLGPAPFPAAVALAARRSGEPRVALVRLFVLGETLPAAEIPVDVRTLAAHGFVEELGDVVRPLVRLTPYEGMLFAHDGERNPSSDFVTGVNNTTRTTTTLTVRSEVESALDMGTGCGVPALLATRHARTVVATDVNRRALRYAAINARLNGRALDTRSGNWFEPVAGEHFDLIVSNPPYVISPDADYLYRDSGLEGDEVSREIVRAAAAHLREGGFATILCNWICRSEGETWQPLEPWVEDLSCD